MSASKFIKLLSTLTLGLVLIVVLGTIIQPKAVFATAGITKKINFQGKLVNGSGVNVPNSTPVTLIFSIYNVSSGGSALWTENQTVTPVDGLFQVQLGSSTALPGSVDFNSTPLYLGIQVQGEASEMSPRIEITAVPEAFDADRVKTNSTDTTGNIDSISLTGQITSANALNIDHTATYNGGAGVTNTGSLINLNRNLTSSGTGTALSLTKPLLGITDNCSTAASGTCSDSSNLLSLTQSYSSATGDVLTISDAGSGNAISVSDGTNTNATLTKAGILTLGKTSTTTGGLTFAQSGGTGTTTFQAGAQGSTSLTYTLPTSAAAANSGYFLTSTTAGVLSWSTVSATCSTCLQQAPSNTAANTVTVGSAGAVALTLNSSTNATPQDAMDVNLVNTSGTATNGISVTMNGSGGTVTNGINITQTAGTLTNGLSFNGTIGTDITTAAGRTLTITPGAGTGTGTGGGLTITTGAGGGTSGNSGTLTLNTGNVTSGTAGNIVLNVGTSTSSQGAIQIGTASRAQTITIGNSTSGTAFSLTGNSASTISAGSSNSLAITSTNFSLATDGTITLPGHSSGAPDITTNNTLAKLTIQPTDGGFGFSGGTLNLFSGGGDSGAGALNIEVGSTSGGGGINIGKTNATPISIGTAISAKTITIGSTAADTIYIGHSATSGKTIGIGDGAVANALTIGNTTSGTTLSLLGTASINTTGTLATSIGNSTGTLALTGSTDTLGSSTIVLGTGDGGTPVTTTIRGAAAGGGDTTGSNLIFAASNGNGAGGSGKIIFQTAPAISSSFQTITFDASATGDISPGSQATWSQTIGNNSNRILVVGVTLQANMSVTSATFGSQNLTFAGAVTEPSQIRTEIWYLFAPTVGTGTVTVNTNISGNILGGSTSWYNVNQSTAPTYYSNHSNGSSSNVSVSTSTAGANDMVVDNVGSDNSATATQDGTQTSRYNYLFTGWRTGGSSKTGASSMLWTMGGAVPWAISAISFSPTTLSS